MRLTLFLLGIALLLMGLVAAGSFWPGTLIQNSPPGNSAERTAKDLARRIREAETRSANAKGVYMSADVANDRGRAATKLRGDIMELLDITELNAVVIDVKETRGGVIITDQLRELINILHEKNVWVIARQVVFKDSSQEKIRPDWYLKKKNGGIWRDNRGGSWLDPSSPEVWSYQLAVAKAAGDAGFDEVQFDYIRFPSDGDLADAVYPLYRPGQPKYAVLASFFRYLHEKLKDHRPDLMLSADLFGYVALQEADLGIGQRLADVGENFDYISLMVYPSHYYGGFQVAADPARNLPALWYPYRASDAFGTAPSKPYDIVHRSLLIAGDILAGRATTTGQIDKNGKNDKSAATSSPASLPLTPPGKIAKLRPWLQDFDLGVDTARGIYYDAKKVRAQIDAAEDAGSAGWLLWSPTNIYTKEALRPARPARLPDGQAGGPEAP